MSKGIEKREKNLKMWSKGQSGNPKGRPKKLHSQLTKNGYKLSEVNDTIQNLMAMTKPQLEKVENHPKATVLEITVARAILSSMRKGTLYSLETLLSRVYGQPKQEVKAEITATPPLFPDVKSIE